MERGVELRGTDAGNPGSHESGGPHKKLLRLPKEALKN